MKKDEIRKTILNKNSTLTDDDRFRLSQLINEKLLTLLNEFKSIALFYPMQTEPNIIPVVESLLKSGKIVSLPKIESVKERKMNFIQINSIDDLEIGKYGIMAPRDGVTIDNFDAIVVPTVGVNYKNQRLGMGGGFYDSFCQNHQSKLIAPVYSFNTDLEIDFDTWDIMFDYVVTEKSIFKIK